MNTIDWDNFCNYNNFTEHIEIIEKIGEGNNSQVFRGKVTMNQEIQEIAVKLIKLPSNSNIQDISCLNYEYNQKKLINHPNILKIYFNFYYETDNCYYIGMELGSSNLKQAIEYGDFNLGRTSFLVNKIYLALRFLEQNQLLHANLKLENIILCLNGSFKLSDSKHIMIKTFHTQEIQQNTLFQFGVIIAESQKITIQQSSYMALQNKEQYIEDAIQSCTEKMKNFFRKYFSSILNKLTFSDIEDICSEKFFENTLNLQNKKLNDTTINEQCTIWQNKWKMLSWNDRKSKVKQNSGLTVQNIYNTCAYAWNFDTYSHKVFNKNLEYKKYEYEHFGNRDGSESWSFITEEIPKARKIMKQLAKQMNLSEQNCLKMLHATLWNCNKIIEWIKSVREE